MEHDPKQEASTQAPNPAPQQQLPAASYGNWTDAEKVGKLTKQITLSIDRERNRYLNGYELTATQTDVLQYVSYMQGQGKELNQVDIERQLQLSNPTLTGVLKRLQSKGFILKKPSNKDRRYNWICLTEKAEKIYYRSRNNKRRIEQTLLRGLSPEEIQTAIHALQVMAENMQALNDQSFDD